MAVSKYTDMLSPQEAEPAGSKYKNLLTDGDAPRETPNAIGEDSEIVGIEGGETQAGGKRPMSDIVASKSDPSTWERVKNVFTGGDRQTRATEELPELLFSGILSDVPRTKVMAIAPALTTTFDPSEQADIIQSNVPHIRRQQDEKGNIILVNENTGAYAMVNKPGLSLQDVQQGAAVAAEYYPASLAAQGGKRLTANMAKVGAASGATETVNQTVQAASGGSFGPAEIGTVAVGGAAFEGIGTILARALTPIFNKTDDITPEIRQAFHESAAEVGLDPTQMTDDVIQSYFEGSRQATRNVPEGEFGIRYTQGQRAGDLTQQATEERLRRGPSGTARRRMEQFSEAQGEDIMAARGRITEGMGEGIPIDRPVEAGERVIEGVRGAARAAERAVDDAYGEVGSASLKLEGQRGMATRLQRVAFARQFDMHPETAPMTARTMGELREMQWFLDDVGGRAPRPNLRHLERFRQRLNKRINAADKEDFRQMTQIKREYDNYLRRAADHSLFSGDETALRQLRDASGLHADYMRSFTQQDVRLMHGGKETDTAGRLINRMVEYDDLNPEEVVNFIFGVSKLGRKKDAARAVAKIRNIVGRDSPEFTSLRQAAFLRLTDPGKNEVFSGARMLTNLTDAVDNQPTLINSLFSRPEQAMMLRFAREVVKAQPTPQNPSGTAHMNAGYVADIWGKMLTGFGFAQGGAAGAIAAKGGSEAVKEMGKWRSGVKASDAISQTRPLARIGISGVASGSEAGRNITGETLEGAGDYIADAFEEDSLKAAP